MRVLVLIDRVGREIHRRPIEVGEAAEDAKKRFWDSLLASAGWSFVEGDSRGVASTLAKLRRQVEASV